MPNKQAQKAKQESRSYRQRQLDILRSMGDSSLVAQQSLDGFLRTAQKYEEFIRFTIRKKICSEALKHELDYIQFVNFRAAMEEMGSLGNIARRAKVKLKKLEKEFAHGQAKHSPRTSGR